MTAPESIYPELKGQPAEKILREIRAYRREIARLKRLLEAADRYLFQEMRIAPSPAAKLMDARKCLAVARCALEVGGGTYPATKAEQRAEEMHRRLKDLVSVTLERNYSFEGTEVLRAELHMGMVRRFERPYDSCCDIDALTDTEYRWRCKALYGEPPVFSREEFLRILREVVHIGEWKRNYRPYFLDGGRTEYFKVLDRERWKLRLEFSEGEPFCCAGSNAYPFAFDELISLLGGKRVRSED